jgi:hypothetical protein
MIEALENGTATFAGIVWGLPLVFGLCFSGIFFTIYFKFPQLRFFKHAILIVSGKLDKKDKKEEGEISHFQALCTALSATVGLGNIAGVAIAIALGGPGAVFWLWVAGFIGMATKFTEVGYVGRDVESMVRDLMENAIQIVEKQKRSDVYAKAYEAALERLSKVMRPGTKKAKPKQEGMNDWQNMFKNLGMPLPESQEEEVEEIHFFDVDEIPEDISDPIRPVLREYMKMRKNKQTLTL